MKTLVTGGAGFVGSHLVDSLLEAGHDVRILDNLDPQVHGAERQPPDYLNPKAELQVGDVRDRDAVSRAMEDVDVVYHQAAAVGVGQSMYEIERYVSVNSVGAAVVLEEAIARRDQLRRLIVASSMSIYGEGAYRDAQGAACYPGLRSEEALARRAFECRGPDGSELTPEPTPESKPLQPTSIYAVTKRDHEEMFLSVGAAYGIPTVALRYFNIYGTRQSLSNPYTGVMAIFSSRLLNQNPPVIFEDGAQTRDFVNVADIVQANLLALEGERAVGGVYNIGTGQPTSVARIAEVLAERLDFGEPAQITGEFRAGDIRHCYADISRARADLGFEPKVGLEAGMDELLSWLRGQRPDDRVAAATQELKKRGLAR